MGERWVIPGCLGGFISRKGRAWTRKREGNLKEIEAWYLVSFLELPTAGLKKKVGKPFSLRGCK